MHRIVLASLPLALFVFIAFLSGAAKADNLAQKKLEFVRGPAPAPAAAQGTPIAPSGRPLFEAKHLRGPADHAAARQLSSLPDLVAAKRRARES